MADVANTSTLSTNFNVAPYYDDFDEQKNYHRVVFLPGQSVQARELTQMQTILQNQIDRFASHIFKEGSSVSGMEIAPLDNQYDYVKLRDTNLSNASVNVYSFLDKKIKGSTSGVIAQVVNVTDGSQANTPNFKTLFVDYLSANTTTSSKVFVNNETLFIIADPDVKANTITSLQGEATGYGSAIRINSGILFAKDHFIRVDAQTIILDKYSNTPSYRVGFAIDEHLITSAEDETLLDPASGSYNFAAPGAHRLKLNATLMKLPESQTEANNFIEYVRIKNGVIQAKADNPQYNALRDQLAKRTYEESGDYIVRGLTTRIREHLNDGTNQGVYTSPDGNANKLCVDVEPGKAYVQGYENELLVTTHVPIDKGIDTKTIVQGSTYTDYGNYVIVYNVVGNWDVNGHDEVTLRGRTGIGSAQANAITVGNFSTAAAPGTEIGKARVRGIELLSGNPGSQNAQYKLFLSDIRITGAGKSFANTECIAFEAGGGLAKGRADILNSNNLNANTVDQTSTAAIYNLPAQAIKRLRSASGLVNTDYFFYKMFNSSSFDTSGSMTLLSTSEGGSSSETFSGSGALTSATARSNFYIVVRSASANTSNLTGTITVTSGSPTVVGSGTAFTTQINPGDIIACSPADRLVVASVNSPTSLTLTANAPSNRSGTYHKRFIQGQVLDPAGVGRNGNRSVTINSSTSATIALNESINGGLNASVLTKLNKINAQEASKTILRNRLVEIKMGSSGVTGYTANTAGPWPLGVSDAFRLVSVRKKTGARFSSTTEGVDVTSEFTLDNGQRETLYDHARLVKKPLSNLSIGATDRLLVSLDYFSHTNRDRGYFSIDSYPINDTTAGANSSVIFTYQVPIFTSPTTGVAYDLRNCIDFRPRLTDSANSVTTLTNISTNPLGIRTNVYSLSSAELTEPTGGLRFPVPSTLFEADMEYYLPRKDLITMDADGRFASIRGTSEAQPKTPPSNPTRMTLAVIDIAPYPSLPDEIARRAGRSDLANTLRAVKNERFTMRDIGVIRDRVDRLEYYTTLSLLEKDAKDLTIRDGNGNDRFKNGFLVDSFIGHSVGNVYDPDYKISVDPSKKEGRPLAKIDAVELVLKTSDSSNIVRTNVTQDNVPRDQTLYVANSQVNFAPGTAVSSGLITATVRHYVDNRVYVENATGRFGIGSDLSSTAGTSVIEKVESLRPGRLITLPYNHDLAIQQPNGTTTRNTAGLFYNWIGNITLDPSSDYWVDTVLPPEIQANIDNNADNWETMSNPFGSEWGSWDTVISGQPTFATTDSVDSVNNQSFSGGSSSSTTTTNLQTYTPPSGDTRIGTNFGVNLTSQLQSHNAFVRNVNIQPFMRSRPIRFTGRGFKPSSRLYAFFDGTNVTDFITPTTSSFIPIGSEGSGIVTNENGDVFGIFRIPNQSSLRFRRGEKVFRLTDNFTNAIAPGLVTTAGQTIFASEGLQTDVAVNRVTEVRVPVPEPVVEYVYIETSPPVTPDPPIPPKEPEPEDFSIYLVQDISRRPNPDVPVVVPFTPPPVVDTTAEFLSHFVLFNTMPDIPIPPAEPEPVVVVVPEPVFDQPDDFFIDFDAFSFTRWAGFGGGFYDPIAQTFLVDTKSSGRLISSGAYITKIDLFFATKDETFPVIVEIREVDSATGYPTPRVLPYARATIDSYRVNVSSDGSKPTPIEFSSPIYVEDGKQYAIVVLPGGGNPNYSVWISRLGETDILTGNRVSVQPATGILFASSNDLTYTALQDEDMKFNIYYADFSVSRSGRMVLKNEPKDYLTIANVSAPLFGFAQGGEVVVGETYLKGTFAPGNNLTGNVALGRAYAEGMTSGARGEITYLSTANGEVRLRNVTSLKKFAGGESIRFRLANSVNGVIAGNSIGGIKFATFPFAKVAYYNAADGSNIQLHLANVSFANSGSATGTSANNRTFVANRWIRSQENGVDAKITSVGSLNLDLLQLRGDFIAPSNTSIRAFGQFATSMTTRDSLEFPINLNRDTKLATRRYIHSVSNEANTLATSSTMKEGSSLISIDLESRSRYSSPTFDTSRIFLTSIENVINNSTTGEANTSFGGSALAKYITRKVVLADGQDAEDLVVFFEGYRPPGTSIKTYYKILNREDSDSFDEARWIEMTESTSSVTAVSASDDENDFFELQFNIPNYPTGAGQFHSGLFGNTNPTRVVAYRNSVDALYFGYKYFAIKIVLSGTNTTNPPRIRALRAIALQK